MNPIKPIHTSDKRHFDRLWLSIGGRILAIRGTGENRYLHDLMPRSIKANGRRQDVPAVLLSQINKILRKRAANDENY